jgi:heme/copper-type cytochrome/quinol oxidase subunit 2
MRRLFTAIVAFTACLVADARAAMEAGPGSPPSESGLVIWILVAVFAFFVLVIGFTWYLIKSERRRQLEHKPRE